MSIDQKEEPRSAPATRVILVHGTGAGLEANTGDAWWQRGSAFAETLRADLGMESSGEHLPFHWSGRNWERDRQAAAVELGQLLEQLEASGKRYHLIGHSHGGSVILGALREVTKRGRVLNHLASITTVGTPYLRFGVERLAMSLLVAGAVSVAGAALAAYQLRQFLPHVPELWNDGITRALIWLPVLWLVALTVSALGIMRLVAHGAARSRADAELVATEQVASLYGSRWLNLASKNDEAINGLASTLGLGGRLTPRLAGGQGRRKFIWRLARPLLALYDRIFAEAADEFVWERVRRTLQGNDRTAAQLVAVARSPTTSIPPPPLDNDLEAEMLHNANSSAANTLGGLRTALGLAAVAGAGAPQPLLELGAQLSWRELIHTSYFEYPALRDLIFAHIARLEGTNPHEPPALAQPPQPLVAVGQTGKPSMSTRLWAVLITAVVLFSGAGATQLYRDLVRPYAALDVPPASRGFVSLADGISFAYPKTSILAPSWTMRVIAIIKLNRIGSTHEFTNIVIVVGDEVQKFFNATDNPKLASQRALQALADSMKEGIEMKDLDGSRLTEKPFSIGSLQGFRLSGKVGNIPTEAFPPIGKTGTTTEALVDHVGLIDPTEGRVVALGLTTTAEYVERDTAAFERVLASTHLLPLPQSRRIVVTRQRPSRTVTSRLIEEWLARQPAHGVEVGIGPETQACGIQAGLWRQTGDDLVLTKSGAAAVSQLIRVGPGYRAAFKLKRTNLVEILEIRDDIDPSGVLQGQEVRFRSRDLPPAPLESCFKPFENIQRGALRRFDHGWRLTAVTN